MKKNLLYIILNIIILLITFFISPSFKKPFYLMYFIIEIIILTTLIIQNKSIKNIQIITNQFDILVYLFLILSSIIPLIFKTYISYYDQINYLLQSIFIINIYIFIKNIINKNFDRNNILKILIYSSILIIIIGIDRLSTNFLWNKISNIDMFKIIYDTDRLVSTFSYPNALAVYLSMILFITFLLILKTNNIFYKIYSYILMLSILLTKSRGCLILLIILIIIYLYLINKKADTSLLIKNILINIFGIILYYIMYLVSRNILFSITISTILVITLNFIKFKISIKISKKHILITLFILTVLILFINFISKYSKPLVIDSTFSYKIKDIKKNKAELKIYFTDIDDNSTIQIIEKNIYYQTISDKTYKLKEKNIFKFNKNDLRKYIFIKIRTDSKIVLNEIYLNNKEYIINYKYLPSNIIRKLKNDIDIDKSFNQRLTYYKDAYKIIKKNYLFGIGHNGWKNYYQSIEEYSYGTLEVHSFILDTFISFGIFPTIIISLLIISIVYFYIKKFKVLNETDISIFFAILIIFIHSIIDFDMSYQINYVLFMIFISLINSKTNKTNNIYNFSWVIITLFSCGFILINLIIDYKINKINDLTAREKIVYYDKYKRVKNWDKIYNYNYIKITNTYLTQFQNNKNSKYNNYVLKLIDTLLMFSNKEKYYEQLYIENLLVDYLYNNYKIINNVNDIVDVLLDTRGIKYDYDLILERLRNKITVLKLNNDNNLKNKIKENILDCYNEDINILSDKNKTDYNNSRQKYYIEEYKNIITNEGIMK